MRDINWVFGGTGVGKRTFIQQMTSPLLGSRDYREAFGLEKGDLKIHELLDYIKRYTDTHGVTPSLFVRWQWSRENELRQLISCSAYTQAIYLLTASEDVYLSRVRSREDLEGGSRVWNDSQLLGDAESVKEMCEDLYKKRCVQSLIEVDVTGLVPQEITRSKR